MKTSIRIGGRVYRTLLSTPAPAWGRPRPPWPPAPEMGVRASFRFDDAEELKEGPLGPLVMPGAQWVESWSGYALRAVGPGPAGVILPMGRAGDEASAKGGAGALRFWFAPEWSGASAGGAQLVLNAAA